MAGIIKLKRGLNIPLKGKIEDTTLHKISAEQVGIVPDDFPGYTWKIVIKAGDNVAPGTPLLKDKDTKKICIVSPVGGVVEEIRRGPRRKIEAIVVKCNRNSVASSGPVPIPASADADAIIEALCSSGLWAFMRQRPYDIVPNPEIRPRDIFITAFDSAPLALPLLAPDHQRALDAGVAALKRLTDGKVYLGVAFGSGATARDAEVIEFQGPHPAGNVGVQIAAVKPVNKGETVWTLDARTAVRIGKLVADGALDMETEVGVGGPGVMNPIAVQSVVGASIKSLLRNVNIESGEKMRVISGNVLTGAKVDVETGFLRYPYRQITVIPEGNETDEFMGWASINPKKFSVKRSFPAFLRGLTKPYDFDSRIKGGRRAMILSGEYDKVFPMNIYPEYLIKAILSNDIERMEKLGIYEVAPEDFALPEFVDTSKLPLQQIVKEGLENLRKEM